MKELPCNISRKKSESESDCWTTCHRCLSQLLCINKSSFDFDSNNSEGWIEIEYYGVQAGVFEEKSCGSSLCSLKDKPFIWCLFRWETVFVLLYTLPCDHDDHERCKNTCPRQVSTRQIFFPAPSDLIFNTWDWEPCSTGVSVSSESKQKKEIYRSSQSW